MAEKYLSPKEVAERYGLSVAWVYRCADLQAISFKVGKYLRWRESDLIAMEEYRDKQPRGYRLSERAVMRQTDKIEQAKRKLKFDIKEA